MGGGVGVTASLGAGLGVLAMLGAGPGVPVSVVPGPEVRTSVVPGPQGPPESQICCSACPTRSLAPKLGLGGSGTGPTVSPMNI